MPDDRLALSVKHADGRVTRWGPDEPDGEDIPNDLTFSDSIPGGFDQLSTNLLRRIDVAHADEALFDDVRCYGPGGRTAWNGYMAQFARTHGDGYGVSPGAVGYSSMLKWDGGFSMVYIDRDLSRWQGSSRAQIISDLASSFTPHAHETAADVTNGSPALLTQVSDAWAAPFKPTCKASYDAGSGNNIGSIRSSYSMGTTISVIDTNWNIVVSLLNTDDGTGSVDSSPDLQVTPGTSTGAVTVNAAGARRFARINQVYGATPAGTAGTRFQIAWTNLRVLGDHGLTVRGTTTPSTEGLYASDIVAHVVAATAPLLRYSTGPGGSIEPASVVIPHAVYRDPTTAEFVISDVNKYHLYDWGVYDNREFFFRQPNPHRVLWEARLSDGARLDADGDTAEQVINGVCVTWTDAAGTTQIVGPPGTAFDATDSQLVDTSSSNPVNAHGMGRKWVPLTISFPTNLAGATAIGAVYLAERSLAGRRGSLTLTGTATHPREGRVPCWRVRAGDWITLKDLNGSVVPRKIISKSYSHGSRQVTLQLDNTVAKLDAILARVGVQAGVTTGGGF